MQLNIYDPSPPLRGGVSMLGSRVLALWRGINGSTSMIIGLGVLFGISPLGTSGHANGVPIRGINPQTIKALYINLITAIDIYLENLKHPP
jgi:hypothetical protein